MTAADTTATSPAPLISVAMATYNGEAFLREQIESILGQHYPNLELVICDDASTDRTPAILEGYRDDPRIRVESNTDKLGTTRNFERAITLCRGDYVALADQDDIWHSNKLSKLLEVIRDTGAWLAFSDATLIDRDGKILAESFARTSGIRYTSRSFKSFYLFNCVTGCTALVDRQLLSRCLPLPEGLIVHDWWLAFVAARMGRLAFTTEKLVSYRLHAQNQIGLNRLSLRNNLMEMCCALLSASRLRGKCAQLLEWRRIYQAHFDCCRQFEQAQGFDTVTSQQMLRWADDINRCGMVFRHAATFAANPELFFIIPKRLRFFVAATRLISARDLPVVIMAARIVLAATFILLVSMAIGR